MILPPEARPLVAALVLSFTNPTCQRFSTLLVGALPTTGRRTVANLLRTLRHLAPGHRTDRQRVLSRAPWSGLELGCALMRPVIDRLVPDGPITLVGDDTVDGHKGQHVYGKARDRGRPGSKHHAVVESHGIPLGAITTAANVPDVIALPEVVDAIPVVGPRRRGRRKRRPRKLYADRAYDSEPHRRRMRRRGIEPVFARRGTPHGSGLGKHRWPVERFFA